MVVDAPVKLPGDAAETVFVTEIRRAEAAGGHAAEAGSGFQKHHGSAHPVCLNGRDNARRRAAVDHDIGGFRAERELRNGGRHRDEAQAPQGEKPRIPVFAISGHQGPSAERLRVSHPMRL